MRSLKKMLDRGQSPWYDNLSRQLLISGELDKFIEEGIVGITSNPTIFDNSISKSDDYDEALRENGLQKIA